MTANNLPLIAFAYILPAIIGLLVWALDGHRKNEFWHPYMIAILMAGTIQTLIILFVVYGLKIT